jgi:hypothetical protein
MDESMRRFAVLKPHIEDGAALTAAARARSLQTAPYTSCGS